MKELYLPSLPCVYFLYNENVLQYIGCTSNLLHRIGVHRYTKIIQFDYVGYIEYQTMLEARNNEKFLIRAHRPQYNGNLYDNIAKKPVTIRHFRRRRKIRKY